MKIEAVIVDKVPDSAHECQNLEDFSIAQAYDGSPMACVSCKLYGGETYLKPFNRFLERCIFCPLMTKEEYMAALEAE